MKAVSNNFPSCGVYYIIITKNIVQRSGMKNHSTVLNYIMFIADVNFRRIIKEKNRILLTLRNSHNGYWMKEKGTSLAIVEK